MWRKTRRCWRLERRGRTRGDNTSIPTGGFCKVAALITKCMNELLTRIILVMQGDAGDNVAVSADPLSTEQFKLLAVAPVPVASFPGLVFRNRTKLIRVRGWI